MLGSHIDELDTPTILIDLDALERNVARMADFVASVGVALRPHCKTHKTLEIARWQRERGAAGLTVAKLDEAEAYLDDGHTDVFVANQVVGAHKWSRLAAMQRRGRVAVGVDDAGAAEAMGEVAHREGVKIAVLVEVDCGLARAGLPPGGAAADLAERVARLPGLELAGLFTHAGHAYAATPEEIPAIGRGEAAAVVETAELLRRRGVECPVVSVGSTPTVRFSGAVDGVTEIRPGNYVFNDRMQVAAGSAELGDCALTVLSTVTSTPTPERAVADAGAKTFALDRGAHGNDRLRGFGEDPRAGAVLERLSEEHGVLRPGDRPLRPGDRLRFVPNHACTVANLARVLVGVRADRVERLMEVAVAGGGR